MAKVRYTQNSRVNEIFDDLERYLDFCRTYGYKYDEATLYNMESPAYRQYSKFTEHKNFSNRWTEDAKAFEAKVFG